MRRRDFVAVLGGVAATLPLAARAQQPQPTRRIGILMNRAADSSEGRARVAAIQQRLQELGWREGQNLLIEVRWGADDAELERKGAAELAALAPDVILAGGTFGATAMVRASRTIPIVFAAAVDPVGLGVVASLARPGGNATGFLAYEFTFGGKMLELLKQIAPGVTRAAILRDLSAPHGVPLFAAAQSAAASMGVEVTPVDLHDTGEMERAIAGFARSAGGGLVLMPGGAASARIAVTLKLATQYKLPTVYAYRHVVIGGGLVSYGPDWLDEFRRAAEYVDRILKGEKPADLPVQAPTKYELAVNLKTAKTLGLTVPDSILVRADEVIE
jgi:putative tryptophan/tyrosine transport system substrate-binding protein